MHRLLLLAALLLPQGAAAYDPQGVHVDAEGVLRSKTVDSDPRLADLWKAAKSLKKDDKLLYISLPRLFAEAKKLIDAKKPLPDEIRYLGGMTKLQYLFAYPDDHDIVIAGTAEPFDASVPYRPLGKLTGRPVLHFDDLVVALRAFATDKKPDRLGCDIELTKEIADRVSKKINEVGPTAQYTGIQKAADKIAEAGGPQPVKFYGLDPETRFAFVCVEADYRLKQLALGIYKSPVSKVVSYKSLIDKPEEAHRFSLESNYDALAVSPSGNAFHLKGASLKVNGGLLGKPESKEADMSPAARQFARQCNENFDALLRHMVCWADLANLGDLSVVAALVAGELAKKTGWELGWIVDPKQYAIARMIAPKSAATLCSFTSSGKLLIFMSGGVWIKPAEWAEKRAKDEQVEGKAARPGDGWNVRR